MPDLKDLHSNNIFMFMNTDELLDLRRPLSYKTRYIGGIGIKKNVKRVDQVRTTI